VKQLGALESAVMEVLWEHAPATVRQVAERLGERLAYTTVMTTLDRLHRKRIVTREKEGNAFVYCPAFDRAEHHRRLVERAVSTLLDEGPAESVLAGFVDAAAVDEEHLAHLEQLIAERRRK
jgi:predicted transcriptional regulator